MTQRTARDCVSILIPAYNSEKWLSAAIESALGQTHPTIEVIVVDDGSTDGTLAVAESFTPRGVKVIHQTNRGAAAARNRALAESTGEWIQFLDADDLLHSEKIARQLSVAHQLGPDFLYSCAWGRFTSDVREAVFHPSPLLQDSDPVDWLVAKYARNDMVQPGAWLTHRSLIDRAGCWDERMLRNDDGEFFDRVTLLSKGIKYVADAMTFYRSNIPDSLCRRISRPAAEADLLALNLCTERLLRAENDSRAKYACAIKYKLFSYEFYPMFPDLALHAYSISNNLHLVHVDLPGGKLLKWISKIVGWKMARQIQYFYYQHRKA